jgi:hypothetical protein
MMFDPVEIQEGCLVCPCCRGEDRVTHIDAVYATTRAREDADPLMLCLGSRGMLAPVEPEDYPHAFGYIDDRPDTGRRHEFVLSGWCETCGATWYLTFRQHKGSTLIAVRVGKDARYDPTDQ